MPTSPSRLEEALSSPAAFQELLGTNDHVGLAERIDDALHGSRQELRELALQLDALVAAYSRRLPQGVADQLGQQAPTEARLAYEAGLLGFAQLFSAHAVGRRAPERVQSLVLSVPLSPYIRELSKGERSNSELADLLGEAAETVSRKMKKLRLHGIADNRRDGRISTNFLTPLGRAMAGIGYNESSGEEGMKDQAAAESRRTRQMLMDQLLNRQVGTSAAAPRRTQPILDGSSVFSSNVKIAHGY